jgi:hypothetical protein
MSAATGCSVGQFAEAVENDCFVFGEALNECWLLHDQVRLYVKERFRKKLRTGDAKVLIGM